MSAVRVLLSASLLLAVTACPGGLRGDEQSRVADEATLRGAGLKTTGPALLEFFRLRTPSDQKRQKLAEMVRRLGDRSFRVRQQASANLTAAGQMSLPFLRPALADPDLEVARRAQACVKAIVSGPATVLTLAAARLLTVRQPAGAADVVLAYLPFTDDEGIEDELVATLGVVGLAGGKADPALIRALKDGAPARRAAAALLLGASRDADLRAAVRPLLTDADPRVRLRAAQGLIDGKDKEAVPVLIALLREPRAEVSWQAEELLCRVAGDQAPQVSVKAGDEVQCRKCAEAWTRWWRDHGRRLDLAGLRLEQRLLGLTLIVVMDGHKGGSAVWECGLDGKPRWEITGLQSPIDAQVLPGNRVLVAEYGGRAVTERDFKGKVLWEHKLNSQPVTCQRLANGNTLVATLQDIVEVTRAGKDVFRHTVQTGMIFSAQKRRDGHVIYVTYEGKLTELDARGKELRSFTFEAPQQGLVTVEVLPGNHYLIPMTKSGKVVEFDSGGKVVWQCPASSPNAASRLPNGNTLVCGMSAGRVVEVNRAGKVVWEHTFEGRPFRVRRR
ncbi:MAG TPA: PQQ-binding-like beta-propeller repeat protein [Gemmataceae bacterium]|jgi:hypothetical protein|nr:PQQ-binding-like beta-propeller repeat protein [Gemmataceae bacterium]